jgi:hypothetical protein
MKPANEHGINEADSIEEVARCGRSYVAVEICQCEDGLFRYGLDFMYSYGGFSNPISDGAEGFTSSSTAKDAGVKEILRRFPQYWPSEPQSVHDELRNIKAQIERNFCQLSLF